MKYRVDFKPFKGANFGSGIIVYAFSEKTAKKRAIKKARNNPYIPYWKSETVDATKLRYLTI